MICPEQVIKTNLNSCLLVNFSGSISADCVGLLQHCLMGWKNMKI